MSDVLRKALGFLLVVVIALILGSCRTNNIPEGLAADRLFTACCTCLHEKYARLPTQHEVFFERCLMSEETNRTFAINQCVDALHDRRPVLVVPTCMRDQCASVCSFAETTYPEKS